MSGHERKCSWCIMQLLNTSTYHCKGWIRGCSNQGYLLETHLKFKSRLLMAYYLVPQSLKFCRDHGSIITVLYNNFNNNLTSEMYVIDEQDVTRLEFKTDFGGWTIMQHPSSFANRSWILLQSSVTRSYQTWHYQQVDYARFMMWTAVSNKMCFVISYFCRSKQ